MQTVDKKMENQKEDSHALKKFLLILLLSTLGGGVLGFATGIIGEQQITFSTDIKEICGYGSLAAMLLLTTLLIVLDIIHERRCRRMFASWDGEDDMVMKTIDQRLDMLLMGTSICMILAYFFFGACIYLLELLEGGNLHNVSKGYWLLLLIAGLVYNMTAVTLIQKRVINFEKEMNPEKQGSIYDVKFREKWLNSCDEAEKLQIYKASYRAYQVTNGTCLVLWLVTMLCMFMFDIGLLPLSCVVAIWLVHNVSYCLAALRFSKYPSEIMK